MIALFRSIAENDHFQSFILFLILLTAAFMGLETSPTLVDEYSDFFFWFAAVSQGIFLLEIVIRILAADSIKSFFQNGWNKFDFTVVALSLIPAIGPMALIARLLRVLRVLRVFSRTDRLRKYILILNETKDEVYNTFIMTMVLVYVYLLSGYYLFADIDPEHWGSFWSAALSVFYLLLLQDISSFVEPVIATSGFYIIYFLLFYLTFTGILLGCIACIISAISKADHD